MNRMKMLCLLIVSIAMADDPRIIVDNPDGMDVHPGLKNAIDNGDYKTAKILIEKFSIKDVYCPSSLDVSEGVALFGQKFRENPDIIFQKCSPEFIQNFGKNACVSKDDINLCTSYMIRSSLSDLDNYYSQILERGWHKELDIFRDVGVEDVIPSNCFDYKTKQIHSTFCNYQESFRFQVNFLDKNHILWELMVADKEIVAATNQPWLKRDVIIPKDLYAKHQRLIVDIVGEKKRTFFNWTTDSLAVESLVKIYAEKSILPDTSILGACRRNGKIDEIFENTTGLNLFSCAKIIKKYDDHCNAGDKTVKVVDGVEHRLICETNHWMDVSEEDYAVYEVFPYVCNRERVGKIVDAFVDDEYYQFICDGSKWSTFSVSVTTDDFVWMIKNSNKKPEYTDCGYNDDKECSTCINGKKDCGEQGRYYWDEGVQALSAFCHQGWKLPPIQSVWELKEADSNQVKKLQLKNMQRRTKDEYENGCFWALSENWLGNSVLDAILLDSDGNIDSYGGGDANYMCAIRCVKEKPKELSNPIPIEGVTPTKKREAVEPEKTEELSNPIPIEDVTPTKKGEAVKPKKTEELSNPTPTESVTPVKKVETYKSKKVEVKLHSTSKNCDDPNMRPIDRKRCKVRYK